MYAWGKRRAPFILADFFWKEKDIRTADNGAQIDRKPVTIVRSCLQTWIGFSKIACVQTHASDEMDDLASVTDID